MERTDEQILPAVYRFLGESFKASPSQLGVLTLSRALTQALASPLGGLLGVLTLCHQILQSSFMTLYGIHAVGSPSFTVKYKLNRLR